MHYFEKQYQYYHCILAVKTQYAKKNSQTSQNIAIYNIIIYKVC